MINEKSNLKFLLTFIKPKGDAFNERIAQKVYNARSQPIKNEHVELGQYIEVNRKILKVYAVFKKI